MCYNVASETTHIPTLQVDAMAEDRMHADTEQQESQALSGQVSTGPSSSSAWIGLVAIVLLGAALRYLGIMWGLPNELHLFSYHPDEFHSLRGALSLALGDFNPHFFNYGSLYLYLVGFSCLLSSAGHSTLLAEPNLPTLLRSWTLIGREVSLLAAMGGIVAVYLLARQMLGHRQGLLAAGFLAVLPLHVLHSHYATVDITLSLFTTLALLFSVRIYQKPSLLNYVLAGVAVGLAASTKYSGGLVIVAPILAHILRLPWDQQEPNSSRNFALMIGCAIAAFALTSPYTFLDWQNARNDIAYEVQHMRVGEEPARSADPNGYWFHAVGLTFGTAGASLLAVLGAVALLRSAKWRGPGAIIVVFGVLWLLMIGHTGVRYMRYEVPLAPVIAVLAAASPLLIWRRRADLKLAAIAVVTVALGVAVYCSVLIDMRLIEPDDRDQMLHIIAQYVPQNVLVGTVWEPWFQGPPLDYVNGGMVLRSNTLWRRFSRVVRPHVTIGTDAQLLVDQRPFAFVYSNFELRDGLRTGDPGAQRLLAALKEHYELVMSEPTRAPLAGMLGWAPPQDWLYPFPELSFWITNEADIIRMPATETSPEPAGEM